MSPSTAHILGGGAMVWKTHFYHLASYTRLYKQLRVRLGTVLLHKGNSYLVLIMCKTKFWKHPKCGCWSCEISKPCKEDRNFTNCPNFSDGVARNPEVHRREEAEEGKCPKHDKEDDYDGDKIRIVRGHWSGNRFGFGPNESDIGIDLLRPKDLSKFKEELTKGSEGKKEKEIEKEKRKARKSKSEPVYPVICCTVM